MKQGNKRRWSIYLQLGQLLVIASLLAGAFFVVVDALGNTVIDHIIYETDYVAEKNKAHLSDLRTYIQQENLASSDAKALDAWVRKKQIISLEVYKEEIQVFDSNYPNREEILDRGDTVDVSLASFYQVPFSDGTADVLITGNYAYQLRTYLRIGGIILSFILLMVVVLLGIRRKVEYLRQLCGELEVLEGGNLAYEIGVKGQDELAELAQGIEDMRLSFLALVETETEIVQNNQRIITEMSHDLRTPVTSILLYLEILKMEKYKDSEQLQACLSVIEQKAKQMKQLSENLLEYSLVAGQADREPGSEEQLWLSQAAALLETWLTAKGLTLVQEGDFRDFSLPSAALHRILENLSSNICRYADPSSPVCLRVSDEGDCLDWSLTNGIAKEQEKRGAGIGLQSVERLVGQLGGEYRLEQDAGLFTVHLSFPLTAEKR